MNKNFTESMAGMAVKEAFAKATGPVPYTMTNDYLFRAVFQSNEKALKGLVCSLLHLKEEEVEALVISNPIDLGERIYEKEIVMDIKLTLNNKSIINIEMQVDNEHNWTDRSLVYTCRSFGSLNRGDEYVMVKPVIHISFLDFELFPEFPEFYATYQLLNVKNCNKYSDKLTISVVNLNRTDLATEKDKADGVDYWARLFKSTTWEEIKTLAEKNMSIREAASAMYDFTSDEVIREHLEMREEFLRRQRTRERLMEIAEEKLKVAEERLEEAEEKTKEAEEKAKEAEEKAKEAEEKAKEAEEKAKEAEEKARIAEEKARKAEKQAEDSYEKDLEIARLRAELEALRK